jgi:hypothetical protein
MTKFKVGDRVKDKLDGIKGKILFCSDVYDVALIHFDGYREPECIYKENLVKLKPKKPLREFKLILDKNGNIIRAAKEGDFTLFVEYLGESMIHVREVVK